MKKAIAIALLMVPLAANAGVIRFTAKHGYKLVKKTSKVVYKVMW